MLRRSTNNHAAAREKPERAAQRQEAEARRQERAADSGQCSGCQGPIQPWRDSHLCATCARRPGSSARKCSRCGELSHRVETCTEPPAGWLGIGEQGSELVPVPLTEIERWARAQALAQAHAERAELQAAHRAERRHMATRERELVARESELAKAVNDQAELRPVPVRAELAPDGESVLIVRCDTGEVLRRRPLAAAERDGGRQ